MFIGFITGFGYLSFTKWCVIHLIFSDIFIIALRYYYKDKINNVISWLTFNDGNKKIY
jgi:hypothetical protein